MLMSLLIISIILLVMLKIWSKLLSGKCTSNALLKGKTVIITGATAGIGKSTAYDIASRGARLILACRNLSKAAAVAGDIKKKTGNADVIVMKLDTSDLSSVRLFAQEILKSENSLDILINNAGIGGATTKKLSADGLELTMATNHYGHFLLTNLLLGLLKRTNCGRIINVSSLAHTFIKKIDPEDLNYEKMSYSSMACYGQSKLCNVLFTVELANKLKGTGITANSLHPGLVNTEIFEKNNMSFAGICQFFAVFFGKDSDSGAQTTIHLAVSDEVKDTTGKYFVDCKEQKTSDLGAHRGFARKIWEASELDVKLQPDEIHY